MDMAKRIVSDSKLDYPAACNAMVKETHTFPQDFSNAVGFLITSSLSFQETLLVHKDHEQNGVLNDLIFVLQNNGK